MMKFPGNLDTIVLSSNKHTVCYDKSASIRYLMLAGPGSAIFREPGSSGEPQMVHADLRLVHRQPEELAAPVRK